MNESAVVAGAVLQGVAELSKLAVGEGLNIELLVFPSQIVVVASRSSGTTSEVVSNHVAIRLAVLVGSRVGLSGNWLNAAAAPLLTERMTHYLRRPDEFGPGVTISFEGSARVLALKLHLFESSLHRDSTDKCDVAFLMDALAIRSELEIHAAYQCVFPAQRLSDKATSFVAGICRPP